MSEEQVKTDKPDQESLPQPNDFWIVGIGASAGGLEAFEHFFTNMPPQTNMAFVLVQHLDPNRESMLVELLQRHTRMPVNQVNDGDKVKPNHVYIIPPNRDMMLQNGTLHLVRPTLPRESRLAIDFFFRTLAADQREKAIGIILSGTGGDGTLGLQAIKEAGGMVMVQSLESSRYSGMPKSAIETKMVDFVLTPEKMAPQLIKYIKYPYAALLSRDDKDTKDTDSFLQRIFGLLRAQTGHDFSLYKENTIRRRIERRMLVNQFDEVEDYTEYLQQDNREIDALFKELLIGVTTFFRNPEAFEALDNFFASTVMANPHDTDPIRVWVPACSTGEEAYSIAILLKERLNKLGVIRKVQIFATDIDPQAIEKARNGIYPENIIADVRPELIDRHFVKLDSGYQVSRSLREKMVFSVHNLVHDPPFSRLDLISCRNLLIYLHAALQEKIIHLFHYALDSDGILFLGNSESLGSLTSLFSPGDRKWKVFRRLEASPASPVILDLPPVNRPRTIRNMDLLSPKRVISPREAVEKIMLERYTPPGLVINEGGEIIYVHGHTGDYIELAPGEANWNILRMAREGVRMPLANAIKRVQSNRQPVVYETIRAEINNEQVTFKLSVKPMEKPASMKGLLLVIFEPNPVQPAPEQPPSEEIVADARDQRIVDLEQELESTKQYLKTTIEELETSNEELTATNEELQSANEELQSTNEELQTAKEELQSYNEELVTINSELEVKIEELSDINNDLHNLFTGIALGAILLDLDLKIRRFTPAARQVVSLIDTDIERPISHTVCQLVDVDLAKDAKMVLDTLETYEREVQHSNGNWFWMRVSPYRTTENQIKGVTFAFNDVTQLKEVEQQLRQSQNQLTALLQESKDFSQDVIATIPDWVYVYDLKKHRHVYANQAIMNVLGYTVEEIQAEGYKFIEQVLHPDQKTAFEQHLDSIASNTSEGIYENTFLYKHADGNYRSLTSREIVHKRDDAGNVALVLGVARDITNLIKNEAELREREAFIRAITATVPDTIQVYDLQKAQYVYNNRPFFEILGYTSEQIEKMGSNHLEQLTHPADLEKVLAHQAKLAEDKDNAIHEVLYRQKYVNDSWCWLVSRDTPFKRDGNGNVSQYIGITSNVTQLWETDAKLRRSESDYQRLLLILRSSETAIFEQDTDLRYTFAINLNPAFENVNLEGTRDEDLFSPEDAALLTKIKSSVLKTGKPTSRIVNATIDEKVYYYKMFAEPLRDSEDKITGIICAATNITPLQNTLGYFDYVLQQMNIGFYIHTVPLDESTYHSRSWVAILGYQLKELPPPNERLSWILENTHPDDVSNLEATYNSFIEGESETYQVKCRLRHKSGEWIWVSTQSHALRRDESGRVIRLLGIMHLLEAKYDRASPS